jgi:hypothetical protein
MPAQSNSAKSNASIAVIGIDIGKTIFHLIGLDRRGAIVLLLDRGIAVGQGIQRLRRALPDILGTNVSRLSPRLVRIIEALASDWRRFDERVDEVSAEIETWPARTLAASG